jgi:hypothetical protein
MKTSALLSRLPTRLIAAVGIATLAVAAALMPHPAAAQDVINLKGAEAQKTLQTLLARAKANPTDVAAHKSAGILLHQINRATPTADGVEQGERLLKAASQADPGDAETQAWLGSIVTMKALFETDPGKQTFLVKLGTRSMDSAIQRAPENLIVRLVRANNSMELPAFLNRTRFAVEDFERYIALCASRTCPADELQAARGGLAAANKRGG